MNETDQLTAAPTGDLVKELERRGYEVRMSKVMKTPRAEDFPGRHSDSPEGAHHPDESRDVWRAGRARDPMGDRSRRPKG